MNQNLGSVDLKVVPFNERILWNFEYEKKVNDEFWIARTMTPFTENSKSYPNEPWSVDPLDPFLEIFLWVSMMNDGSLSKYLCEWTYYVRTKAKKRVDMIKVLALVEHENSVQRILLISLKPCAYMGCVFSSTFGK